MSMRQTDDLVILKVVTFIHIKMRQLNYFTTLINNINKLPNPGVFHRIVNFHDICVY